MSAETLSGKVTAALSTGGPQTARDIAAKIGDGVSSRSVVMALCRLAANGHVLHATRYRPARWMLA